jgi:hypothetical protein
MLIVCIISGENLVKSHGLQSVPGVALMWGGLVFLIILTLILYRQLLKN